MFGYISVNKPELKVREFERYHAFYCGLCRDLKERHGVTGQITLSYDLTFVALLLSALYEEKERHTQTRCIAHPLQLHETIRNTYTAYAADMNVLLAYYKAADDVIDERRLRGRAAAFFLKRKCRNIVKKYPAKCKTISKKLKEIRRYERENSPDIDACSGAFGAIFAEVLSCADDMWSPYLHRMGFFLGKFVYLMDAYDDREKDAQKNNYNPFIYMRNNDPEHYEERAEQILRMMMSECARAFEALPVLRDAELLRNILYAGVWVRFCEKRGTMI